VGGKPQLWLSNVFWQKKADFNRVSWYMGTVSTE